MQGPWGNKLGVFEELRLRYPWLEHSVRGWKRCEKVSERKLGPDYILPHKLVQEGWVFLSCDEKSLKDFKERSNMIWFKFLKRSLYLYRIECRGTVVETDFQLLCYLCRVDYWRQHCVCNGILNIVYVMEFWKNPPVLFWF